jgi:geranylgeranyl diphosphate synthase type II
MLTLTVEGQDLESRFNHSIRRLDKVDEEFYFRIVETKTCYYTVYGPMQIGALVADQHDRILGILEAIGRPAGIAFQIKDDLLDMTSDEKEFGKKRYGDLYEGKVTLIILHTFADATDAEKEKMNSIYRKDRSDKTEDDIRYLVEAIEKYDGIGYASRRGEKFKDEAVRILEEHENDFPTNSYHPIFRSAVEELYSRSK